VTEGFDVLGRNDGGVEAQADDHGDRAFGSGQSVHQ
jgi:hypothetical protein